MSDERQTPQRKSPVTVEQMPDGIFHFHGGKGGFQITEQKIKPWSHTGNVSGTTALFWNYCRKPRLLP